MDLVVASSIRGVGRRALSGCCDASPFDVIRLIGYVNLSSCEFGFFSFSLGHSAPLNMVGDRDARIVVWRCIVLRRLRQVELA